MNGNSSLFNQAVDFSARNLSAFGESSYSGTWRGAGINGGANVVILSESNGVEPNFFVQNTANAFAGVHMIATEMPTGMTAPLARSGSRMKHRVRGRSKGDSP